MFQNESCSCFLIYNYFSELLLNPKHQINFSFKTSEDKLYLGHFFFFWPKPVLRTIQIRRARNQSYEAQYTEN